MVIHLSEDFHHAEVFSGVRAIDESSARCDRAVEAEHVEGFVRALEPSVEDVREPVERLAVALVESLGIGMYTGREGVRRRLEAAIWGGSRGGETLTYFLAGKSARIGRAMRRGAHLELGHEHLPRVLQRMKRRPDQTRVVHRSFRTQRGRRPSPRRPPKGALTGLHGFGG